MLAEKMAKTLLLLQFWSNFGAKIAAPFSATTRPTYGQKET